MKISTWNVNSIRQRLAHVKDWLEAQQPDVLALQEIKCVTGDFPTAEFESVGYHCAVDGQKAPASRAVARSRSARWPRSPASA